VDNLRENNLKVQEIRVMMHLKHRNIVEMCDFYTSNNQLCIVMEYADGGDLRHEVIKARNGKTSISEELISVWLIQARAPVCAHMHECSGHALANLKTHQIHANNLKIHGMIRH
jgi:serine/threonine protein kinase